jgi:hypothetical protein
MKKKFFLTYQKPLYHFIPIEFDSIFFIILIAKQKFAVAAISSVGNIIVVEHKGILDIKFAVLSSGIT